MRRNCMEIFHYVANEIKDMSNFECGEEEMFTTGAVYNDFDSNPSDILGGVTDEPLFSQSTNLSSTHEDLSNDNLVPQKLVDCAVLEESLYTDIVYSQSSIDCEEFDNFSNEPDASYLEKVYKIATGCEDSWKNLDIADETFKVFEMRSRNDWAGPDSIYDAWLLSNQKRRSWFPFEKFIAKYPHYEERRRELEQLAEEENNENECSESDFVIEDSATDISPNINSNRSKKKKRRIIIDDDDDDIPNEDYAPPKRKYLTENEVEEFWKKSKTSTPNKTKENPELVHFKIKNEITDVIVIDSD